MKAYEGLMSRFSSLNTGIHLKVKIEDVDLFTLFDCHHIN